MPKAYWINCFCRIDDPQCDVSLPIAKKIVAKYSTAP